MTIMNTSQEGFDNVVMDSLIKYIENIEHCYEEGFPLRIAWSRAKAFVEAGPDLLKAMEAMYRAAKMLNSLHNDSDWHEVDEATEAFAAAEKRYKEVTR